MVYYGNELNSNIDKSIPGSSINNPHENNHLSYNIFIILALICMSILIICGNLVVIFCFIFYKKLRTYPNYYLISLSIADFITGIICIPIYLHTLFYNGIWPYSRLFCKLWLIVYYKSS